MFSVGVTSKENSFAFTSELYLEMAKGENVYPYIFVKRQCDHMFVLTFSIYKHSTSIITIYIDICMDVQFVQNLEKFKNNFKSLNTMGNELDKNSYRK